MKNLFLLVSFLFLNFAFSQSVETDNQINRTKSPVNSNDPIKPIDPFDPIDPIGPVNPIGPIKPIKPIDPFDPIDIGSNVPSTPGYHDTQGKFEVSNNGQSTYVLPIALPPSIQSVGPTINLVYSSGQFGGIAGQGWNINSISSIARIATRKDIDGFIDGVDFDDNDKLAFDGQRLILVSGNYWADGSVYKTEVLTNSKIELKGSGANIYFIVTSPDGSRSWYGNYNSSNATDLSAYYIVRFEDTKGNFITYHYNKPFNKAICINEIKFSANINGLNSPLNYIKFNYSLAKRIENVFIRGVKHEKVELLKNIEVYTNSKLFKKYVLTHDVDYQLGYERVIKLQEFNSNNEEANPVNFEYSNTRMSNTNSEYSNYYVNNLDFQKIELSGDFDGDGRLDFLTDDGLYKNLFNYTGQPPISFSTPEKKKIIATTLSGNKLNQFQSIVAVNPTSNQTEFKVYNLNGSSINLTYSKNIAIQNSFTSTFQDNSYFSAYVPFSGHTVIDCEASTAQNGIKNRTEYLEGDYNGDGISEVLIINSVNENHNLNTETNYDYYNDYTTCILTVTEEKFETLLVDLNPNSPSVLGSSGYTNLNTIELTNSGKKYIADFNSDGKSDILVINTDKSYKIFTVNQFVTSPWNQIQKIGEGTIDSYTTEKQLLLGDFNGDGKTDIMLPDSNGEINQTLWHIYYSNPKPLGGEFFTKESHNIVEYWPNSGGYYNTQTHLNNYYALDTNGDGKSDLVRVWRVHYKPRWTINNHDTKWMVTTYANNIGNTSITGNKFTLDYTSPHDNDSNSPDLVIPIVSNYKNNGLDRDIVLVHNHYNRVYYVKFNKDVAEDIRIKKVISSGGSIVDEVEYKSMEPILPLNNGLGNLNDKFYSSNNLLNYPYVEFKKLTSNILVSKLTNTTEGIKKHQDFRYNGLTVNFNGLGIIGFNKTARSAWYLEGSSREKRIWNIYESNPEKRGALNRSYSQLVAIGDQFTFVNSGNPSGIINSTTNNFKTYMLNNCFYLELASQTVNDFITGANSETSYIYDSSNYLLPKTVTTKNYLYSPGSPIGTKVIETKFDNNPNGVGSDYHIGRPTEVNSTISAYGNVSSSKEIFTYSANKLIKTEKRGNTSESKFLIEEFVYNDVGNVIKKTLSSSGYNGTESFSPRITEYSYDPTERFIKTSEDVEGLITTNVAYHPIYGIVTETLSPFGLTSKVNVDHWGKTYKLTNYLGKNTNTTYSKSNNEYITTISSEDESESVLISDALGRPKKSGQKNIDGTWSYKVAEYDYLGRKYRESEPFSSGNPSQWKTTTFDEYGRQKTVTNHTGLTTTLTYIGLKVSATDGIKTTSSTKNVNGHVVSATDNGGTITYQYFADGNLKNSNYNGTIVSMEYDEWGRKKKLIDPSAGEYNYTYNAIGELLTETTPNGTTTNVYDDFGNIDYSSIVGTNTNSKTDYTYDTTTKLLKKVKYIDYNNASLEDDYEYLYDTHKRLYSSIETKTGSIFVRETVFDDFGRPEKELYKASAGIKESSKWIKNTYKNGQHWQILDDATNQVLWQTNTVNERGDLLTATLGNGIDISNTYDTFGFPFQNKHDKSGTNILTLSNTFETQRGNLTSRYNSLFNRNESFQYDSLDRLTHYTNAFGQQVEQIYEVDGRIKQNDLGKYNYINSNKKYQNTSLNLNPDSKAYYENRLGIYNEGFETKQGWNNLDIVTYSLDTSVKRTGNVSLKIANTTTSEKTIHSDVWIKINNAAATQYTYSAWVKSDGSNPEAELVLFMKTETETQYFTLVDSKSISTSNNWVFIEKTFTVPANIKKLNIRLDNNAYGKLWFDDIRIRKTSDSDSGSRELNITYNTWKSPYQIEETNVDKISFTYNFMNNRSVMYYGGLQTDKYQRQFQKSYSADSSMEIKKNNFTNQLEFVTYIGGNGYTAPVVLKSDGVTQNYLYLHRDYLGSIVAISNQAGNIVEKRLFDAWGEILKVQDEQGNVLNGCSVLDRGYTGHEHLQSVNLIHMNGRLYDPKLHRFLQPDNFIQEPYNTQNYNRYAYVLNNPLKYTDVSGEDFGLVSAVLIGALISATTYTLTALLADVPFTVGGFLKATFIGGASGAISFGIGTYATTTFQNLTSRIVFQSLAHGTSQGFISGIQGGDFFVGFASGALSSVASSLWSGGAEGQWQGFGGKFADSNFGLLAFGTVAGGAGAALTGGNFWQGAATGLVVSGLNHLAHKMQEKQQQKKSFEDGLRNVLKSAKVGEEISSDDLVSTYGIPKKAADLIESFTKTSENTIKVDWSDGFSMTLAKNLSSAVFNDGTIRVDYLKNGSMKLSGNAIGIKEAGKIHYNLILNGDFAKIPTIVGYRWKIGK
jgi:RHS repeat-associated protein